MQIKDTSTRPRNLCWAISVAGALLFAVGVVIKNSGFSSVMTPTLVSALNVILLGILGAWRCSFARNQAIEEAGVAEYRKTHGDTEFFADADEAVRLATRANQQFTKFGVPIATILLGIVESLFCLVVWRGWSKIEVFPKAPNPMPLAILGVCCCIAVLIAGSFFVGASREPGCRWLRPAGAWLFFTGFLFLAGGIALFLEFFGKAADVADILVARVALVIVFILAVELILSFVIEFYRPRMPGEEERPLPESRLLALFTEPGGVARNVAASLDYQFGFQVSEVWFYRFLERTVIPLLIIMAIALWLQTCIVVVSTEENGIMERFGSVVSREPLKPGLYFKLPAPFEQLNRFPVEHIQSITIGGHEEEHEEEEEEEEVQDDGHGHEAPKKKKKEDHDESIVLWSSQHAEEEKPFIVAMRQIESIDKRKSESGPAPLSIGLLAAHIPLYYKVNNLYDYSYNHNDPNKTLKNIATREFVRYMASTDFHEVLGSQRHLAGELLRKRIQAATEEANLGIEVVFVSLAGLHPPVVVGTAYDQVVASREAKAEQVLKAEAYAAGRGPAVQGEATTLLNMAIAYKQSKTQVSKAEAERFESQLRGYLAAPRIFMLNSFLDVMLTNGKNTRKYVMAGNTAKEVFNLNLEKKLNASLLDLNLDSDDGQDAAQQNN